MTALTPIHMFAAKGGQTWAGSRLRQADAVPADTADKPFPRWLVASATVAVSLLLWVGLAELVITLTRLS